MFEVLTVFGLILSAWFYCAIFLSDIRGYIERRGGLSEGALERAKFKTQKEYDEYILDKYKIFLKRYYDEEYESY